MDACLQELPDIPAGLVYGQLAPADVGRVRLVSKEIKAAADASPVQLSLSAGADQGHLDALCVRYRYASALDATGCPLITRVPPFPGLLRLVARARPGPCLGGLEGLPRLRVMDLSGSEHITALPAGISELTDLRELILEGCRALAALPEGLG